MLPGDFGTIGAALLAIVPGFLAQSVWARARTWKGPAGDLRAVFLSLALSVVIQLILAPLTLTWLFPVRHRLPEFPERVVTWVALAVLVIPVFGGVTVGKLTNIISDPESPRVRGRLRRAIAWIWPAGAPPSIWDWVFTVKPPHGSFVVIEFEDGRRLAGVFGEDSIALTVARTSGSVPGQRVGTGSRWKCDRPFARLGGGYDSEDGRDQVGQDLEGRRR
jgi:hypothetical protein